MIGLITMAATRFGGLSFAMKALIAVAFAATVALTVTSVYEVWHHKVFRSGYDRALLDIARADDKAVDRASTMRNAWRACRDLGHNWDQSTGRCQ
jgi:glucose-6-phosphate 1-dehydrogenase